MNSSKILVISFSTIVRDPRVMRQIRALDTRWPVTVAGFGETAPDGVDYISLHKSASAWWQKIYWAMILLMRFFEGYYWRQPAVRALLNKIEGEKYSLIIANDLSSLPVALHLARGARVVVDLHEYSPLEFDDDWRWRLLFGRYAKYLCARYLSQVDASVTVADGIAEEYARNYKIDPIVVLNAPGYVELTPSAGSGSVIKLVHHGAAIRSRRLELMIDAMAYVSENFCLDLMLVPTDPIYMKFLRDRAAGNARVQFVDPVPMLKIAQSINSYDAGLYLLPPDNFNHEHALPNKFFEFVQARLAVVIGPSVEMKAIVHRYCLGVVADSFLVKDFALAINSLTREKVIQYKNNSNLAAKALSFESSRERLLSLVAQVI